MVRRHKRIQGFTLIELIVVIVVLSILAAILVPVISNFLEKANQATDNANARLIYNAAAMWFSENNTAQADLTADRIKKYLGVFSYPEARSVAFEGSFSVSVADNGVITVRTSKPATFDPAAGNLVP